MNEDPALSNYMHMDNADMMDYMTSFGPIDPLLAFQHGDSIAPGQLSAATTTTSQYPMSAPARDYTSLAQAPRSLARMDTSSGSSKHTDIVDSATPVASEGTHTDTPSDTSLKAGDSSNSSTPSLEHAPPVPKKTSRRRPLAAQDQTQDTIVVGDKDKTRRTQSLKRNRIAASKCRQKKKVWQHNLEEQKSELESQHSVLQREYNDLLSEASQMKNTLMAHAGCDDPKIDTWIENQAMRFVGDSGARQRTLSTTTASSSNGNGYQGRNAADSFLQASPDAATGLPSPPTPRIKDEAVNFDHMPDELFLDDAL